MGYNGEQEANGGSVGTCRSAVWGGRLPVCVVAITKSAPDLPDRHDD